MFSCSPPNEEIPENILSQNTFESILKEIHLAKATFELHKTKGMGKAQNELANSYQNIYSKYGISAEDFKTTLVYYSVNAEKLEKIYDKVLEDLTKERATLNP